MQPTHHHHNDDGFPIYHSANIADHHFGATDYLAGPACYADHAEPAAGRWSSDWWRWLRRRSLRRV